MPRFSSRPSARRLWGRAESEGVRFGIEAAERFQPEGKARALAQLFVYVGDLYRKAVTESKPLEISWAWKQFGFVGTNGPADPRNDALVVYRNAVTFESFFWKYLAPLVEE